MAKKCLKKKRIFGEIEVGRSVLFKASIPRYNESTPIKEQKEKKTHAGISISLPFLVWELDGVLT